MNTIPSSPADRGDSLRLRASESISHATFVGPTPTRSHRDAIHRFDRLFWRRLQSLAKPYWASDQKWIAFGLLALTLSLSSATKAGSVIISYVNRDMMTALAGRQEAIFFKNMLLIVLYSVVAAPLTAVDGYVVGKIVIKWRQWLTEQFLANSFRDRAFYRISSSAEIDNPDQRVSEDISAFTSFTITFVLQVFWGLVTGASFIVVLWFISPLLTAALVLCVAVGSVLTIVIGRPLIGINFTQRRREADLRHSLVHVRDNAEAIALYGGELNEEARLLRRLFAAIKNYNLLILWQRNLAFFTYTYDFLLVLVPALVLAPAFFAGTIAFGEIAQAGIAFVALRTALSIIVDQFNSVSTFAAVVERLGTYLEAAENPKSTSTLRSRESRPVESRLVLEALTLRTPDRRKTLVRDLSCEIFRNRGLLITGESGAGKTSLVRAISGLWPVDGGRIVRPPLADLMFLPQRPYLMLGPLRDQLCYPRMNRVADSSLRVILKQVSLESLPERVGGFDAELDWKDLLSLGEQQQIAFARVLLNRPAFVFLDEATSALDPNVEELLYKALVSAGITVISVGNRATLRKFHDTILELLGDGDWRMRHITRSGRAMG